MSDQNKFINTYIDTIIATLHEQLGSSLQLKTQLKLANDLLIDRDNTIAQLNMEIEGLRSDNSSNEASKKELLSCQDRLKIAEESHAAIKVKLSHMDTLLNQITDLKREIVSRDEQIVSLKSKITELETPVVASKPEIKTPALSSASTSVAKLNTKIKTTKTKDANDDF